MDNQEEINIDAVKSRAVKGVVFLTGKTFAISIVTLIATGFLTVFLDPKDYGLYWILLAVVGFLSYFSDIGLAAALVQKKEVPSLVDLRTTFTIQFALVTSIITILYFFSPVLSKYYQLNNEGRLLLYVLGFTLLFSTLKTIPSVLMERKLEFNKLIIPQIIENLVYSVIAVFLAWKGLGIRSFTVAVLASSFVGLITVYLLQPWKIGFSFSRNSIKNLFSFGVPYQASSLLATVKDNALTAFLGGILGASGVGLLGWAQKWGQAPLRFFMDHIIKATFPAFARMHDDKDSLKRSLERSIFFISLFVFPTISGLIITSPILVRIIPRYEKWIPALIPLFLISINSFFAAVTTQLTNFLSATGKIKITLKLMVMWTVLTWLLIPYLSIKLGVLGAALGYALVGVSSVIAIYITRKFVRFSFKRSFFKPFVASLIMMVILFILRSTLEASFLSVMVLMILGVFVYALAIYILVGRSIVSDIRRGFETFFPKKN